MAEHIILAVDDEPFNLEIIEEILEDDYQLHFASSGPECLSVVEGIAPEVILLDVSMPDMDGYEVCRQLKSNPATADIMVMFVSARGTIEERIEGYNVGAEDYIVKPFAFCRRILDLTCLPFIIHKCSISIVLPTLMSSKLPKYFLYISPNCHFG